MEAVPPVPLLQRVRERIRVRHYSIRTEQAYCDWIKRFVIFHGKRHPSELGAAEVEGFLTSLAVEGRVSASTQNQAKSALLFLYKEVPSCRGSTASRRRRRRFVCPWCRHARRWGRCSRGCRGSIG